MKCQKFFVFVFSCLIPILGCTTGGVSQNARTVQALEQCVEGSTQQGFLTPTTYGDAPCDVGVQTCISGQWQGPALFPSCDNFSKSCDGQVHGSAVTGYLQPTSPHGVPCTPATKTCVNGSWSGPEVYPTCNEL